MWIQTLSVTSWLQKFCRPWGLEKLMFSSSTHFFTEDPCIPGSGSGSRLFPHEPRVCPDGTVSRLSPVRVPLWWWGHGRTPGRAGSPLSADLCWAAAPEQLLQQHLLCTAAKREREREGRQRAGKSERAWAYPIPKYFWQNLVLLVLIKILNFGTN